MKNLKKIQDYTQKLLQHQKKNTISHFVLFSSEKIGIKERKTLRKKIIQTVKNYINHKIRISKDFYFKLDLKPQIPSISLSISHCKNLAGFLFSVDKNYSIGFDIEKQSRITNRIANRISSQTELYQSPHPSLLWTAKEASVKCFSNQKNTILISECQIVNWHENTFFLKENKACFYSFKTLLKNQNKQAYGFAFLVDNLALAYAETKI